MEKILIKMKFKKIVKKYWWIILIIILLVTAFIILNRFGLLQTGFDTNGVSSISSSGDGLG